MKKDNLRIKQTFGYFNELQQMIDEGNIIF
jgi:hypothetical protein